MEKPSTESINHEQRPKVEYKLLQYKEERESFKKEILAMCRHAFSMKADTMLFFDRSARGYGLLTLKVLPIIQKEYAKINNIPIEDVPLPTVTFFDAPRKGFDNNNLIDDPEEPQWGKTHVSHVSKEKYNTLLEEQRSLNSIYLEELHEKLLHKYGRVLLCDESTTDHTLLQKMSVIEKLDPKDQYTAHNEPDEDRNDWSYLDKKYQEIGVMTEEEMNTRINRSDTTVVRMSKELSEAFPNIYFEIHTAATVGKRGRDSGEDSGIIWGTESVDKTIVSEANVKTSRSTPRIFDDDYYDDKSVVREITRSAKTIKLSPFVKRVSSEELVNESRETKESIENKRVQLRAEYSEIAREIALEIQ